VCYSSNSSFQTSSDTAACIVSLLCFLQSGGAIDNDGVIMVTGSNFDGNTAVTNGNNIFNFAGEDGVVICNDKNTFKSSGGGRDDDSDGNYPPDLCAA
jgi:hypothetical protein